MAEAKAQEQPKDEEVKPTPSTTEGESQSSEAPAKKPKMAYFKAVKHAGLTLQVQKMVKQADGTEKQEVDEQATFTQYYDTWKGDVIRVGYLATDSEKIAKAARADENVEEIKEKEYKQAVEGDADNRPLERAPVPAV